MAGTKTATYSKRTPLSDVSNKISHPARASTRLRGPHSAENPTDQKSSGTHIYDDSQQQDSLKAILPLSGPVVTEMSDVIATPDILSGSSKDPWNTVATDHPIAKRSQRTIKPRVPLNISRTKKKVTLAMHIRKYGSTHDIEC